ncbi:MAG: GNAT family N-acetyltransferase, partial [Bacteroidetes bacterium]|nr:GNAT family N-acetyltransferase [Bacteroidota bacterium]
MIQDIENIELKFLTLDDYQELKETMILSYSTMPNAYWKEHQIKTLIEYFPEGQIVVKVNSQIAGVALSIIVDYQQYEESHTYKDITGNFTFNTHDNEGDVLYGVDVFIKPEFRGLRLGRRLYDHRKELCERLNLKGIAFGGRIPNYHN